MVGDCEKIKNEILLASYWEHFKAAKDMARYLEPDNLNRLLVEVELEKILSKITK